MMNKLFNQVWNKVYKRKIILENDIFFNANINIGEDLYFNLQYLKRCNSLKCVAKNIYNYYIYPSSLTSKFRDNRLDIHIDLAMLYLEILGSKKLDLIPANEYMIRCLVGCMIDSYKYKNLNKKEYFNELINNQKLQDFLKTNPNINSRLFKIVVKYVKKNKNLRLRFLAYLMYKIKY